MSRPSTRRVRLSLREIVGAVALSAMAGGAALGAAVVLGQLLRPAPEPAPRITCCCPSPTWPLLFDDLAALPPPELEASEP